MPKSTSVSSQHPATQMAYWVKKRAVTDEQFVARYMRSPGCALLAARELGVSLSAISAVVNRRAESLQIVNWLYPYLVRNTSADVDSSFRLYLEEIAPADLIHRLENLPRLEQRRDFLHTCLSFNRFLIGQLGDYDLEPVNSLIHQLETEIGQLNAELAQLADQVTQSLVSSVG